MRLEVTSDDNQSDRVLSAILSTARAAKIENITQLAPDKELTLLGASETRMKRRGAPKMIIKYILQKCSIRDTSQYQIMFKPHQHHIDPAYLLSGAITDFIHIAVRCAEKHTKLIACVTISPTEGR